MIRRLLILDRYPIRLLTAILLLTVCICVLLGWSVYHAQQVFDRGERRLIRQEQLRGAILHLDEVLTMSARMAVASGDPGWDARYHRFAPQLDAAIAEAKQLAPARSVSATETDAANQKLVTIEEQAFADVRAGKRGAARALLAGNEYAAQKALYASGMARFIADSRAQVEQAIGREKGRTGWLLAASCVLTTGGLLTALVLLRWKVVQPLKRAAYATTALTAGTWSDEIRITSDDVIGTLQRAFNQMAHTIRQQTDGLREEAAAAERARETAEAARQAAERANAQIADQLRTIEEQQVVIRETSMPILPLTASAVVMPLVGALDEARLRLVHDHALNALEGRSVRHLVVDITGVPVVDAEVTQGLLQLIHAAGLLGTTVVLVGVRPEVAEAIVDLGIDLGGVVTRGTLQAGIAYALGSDH